ncbi:DUF4132 domain-containing protein [Nonomuraea thailandensis]
MDAQDDHVWLRRYRPRASDLIGGQVLVSLTGPEPDDPAAAVRDVLEEGDPFADRLLGGLAPRLGGPQVRPLLLHWAAAVDSRPGLRWMWEAKELLTEQAVEVIPDVLRELAAHRETTIRRSRAYGETVFLRKGTATTLRGLVWTCELIDEPWVVPLLGDVAVTAGTGIGGSGAHARSELLANAAIGVLARRGGPEVVAQLARVLAKARKKTILAAVNRTLEEVAGRAGLSAEQLLERTVPTFGLGPDGTRTEQGLCLSLDGRITHDGRRTIPKSVDRELLAEFRAAARELRKVLAAERFRVERALAAGRVWQWRDVCAYYLDHPVAGASARNLIWKIAQGPAGLPVQVDGRWELAGPEGRHVRPSPTRPSCSGTPSRTTRRRCAAGVTT